MVIKHQENVSTPLNSHIKTGKSYVRSQSIKKGKCINWELAYTSRVLCMKGTEGHSSLLLSPSKKQEEEKRKAVSFTLPQKRLRKAEPIHMEISCPCSSSLPLRNCNHGFASLGRSWDLHHGKLWRRVLKTGRIANRWLISFQGKSANIQGSLCCGFARMDASRLPEPLTPQGAPSNKPVPDPELAKASRSTPQAHPRFQTWVMARQLTITHLHTTQTGSRNRQKSVADVAVSHVTQFSFPKAKVLIANWK